jgi:hypothetical protein
VSLSSSSSSSVFRSARVTDTYTQVLVYEALSYQCMTPYGTVLEQLLFIEGLQVRRRH